MEEALEGVAEEDARAERDAHRLDGLHDGADDVRGRLEAVRPDEVHEVEHRVLAAETGDAKCEMLDDGARRLTVDKITVGERVLKHRDNGVGIPVRTLSSAVRYSFRIAGIHVNAMDRISIVMER
ncbi:hypothetical protein NUW54_g12706 [Trametes sanguinea]|uniref:Uncharacterized protein n=1 Tax=Trametes sanguinea TaxID=158606 RepID=A0ACC1MU72_9APHY|nr:hypothetical protein NUW54_g12706 [Trametes sanguinea]